MTLVKSDSSHFNKIHKRQQLTEDNNYNNQQQCRTRSITDNSIAELTKIAIKMRVQQTFVVFVGNKTIKNNTNNKQVAYFPWSCCK